LAALLRRTNDPNDANLTPTQVFVQWHSLTVSGEARCGVKSLKRLATQISDIVGPGTSRDARSSRRVVNRPSLRFRKAPHLPQLLFGLLSVGGSSGVSGKVFLRFYVRFSFCLERKSPFDSLQVSTERGRDRHPGQ